MNQFIETIKRDNPLFYADLQKERERRQLEESLYMEYEIMRNSGLTHHQIISMGIGNDEMKERYEEEANA